MKVTRMKLSFVLGKPRSGLLAGGGAARCSMSDVFGAVPWALWFSYARRGRKHVARFSSIVALVSVTLHSRAIVSLACSVFVGLTDGPVGLRLEIGVCQRVERSRIAFGKDPGRGRGTIGSTPRTSRLGSRSHEAPTASGGIAVSETIVQQSPSIPPHAVLCRSSPVGGGTSFKEKGLRRGGA